MRTRSNIELMQAPSFELPDQEGKIHKLTDYKGKWVLVYFYPNDDTPGCTTEACSFRDNADEFKKKDVVVLGISKNDVKSHTKFANKFSLNFPILADPELTTIKKYGSWGKRKFMGREFDGTFRNSYLINPKGEIVKTYEGVKPGEHVAEIFSDLETFQK